MTSPPNPEVQRRVLDGLAVSLRTKGLAGTQVDDIVRHARMSKRTFYAAFADKESAFIQLIRENSVATFEEVAVHVGGDDPWESQVAGAVGAYLAALDANPLLVAAVSRELPALGPRGVELHREALDRFAGLITTMTKAFADRGLAVEAVSPEMAVIIVAGIAELVARAALSGQPITDLAPPMTATIIAICERRGE